MIPTPSLYIVNPVAGKGKSVQVWKNLEAKLRTRGISFEFRYTPGPDTVTAVAAQAVREGYDRVIAVGGDGTIREVAAALVGLEREFGVIPAGTGNDFARTLDLPSSVDELIEVVTGNNITPSDLGQINGKYFVNIAGVGVDTEIAEDVNRSRVVVNGTVTYLLSAIRTVLRYSSPAMTITVDDEVIRGRVLVLAVANGKYYGGGVKMLPDARVDDGKFHVLVAKDVGRFEALRLLPLTYSGRHIHNRKCSVYTGVEVSVDADRPLAVQADGTLVGKTPVTFRVVPRALRILTPSPRGR